MKNKFPGNMKIGTILFFTLICHSLAEEVILNLNAKRPVSVTSARFLSFTLDPEWIFSGDLKTNFLSSNLERSINIAKAFSPAYVRFAGPKSNSFTFENEEFLQENQNFSNCNFTGVENILNAINQWAEKSGLNLITCIGQQSNENSENTSQLWNLIAFSDQMGYNTSWQLGYECQSRCDLHGQKLGQEVNRLRRMLNAFPRYSSSLIIGPDITAFKTENQKQYLLDYFNSSGSALSSVTWHPDFDEILLNNNEVIIREESLSTEKKDLENATGQSISEKPLWIAESKQEKCKNQFIGALVWARRLGNAAKVGAQVLMRQPDNSNLFKTTPDFWVSLLHKILVGPEVFNLKIQLENETDADFFCQSTKPSTKYNKGSLTIFGINLTPNEIVANLKGLKIKEVHDYVLLPGFDTPNRMFAETVLLNDELLTLKNGNEIPDIEPIKRKDEKGVALNLPSGGIAFWVIPNLKLKSYKLHKRKSVDKQQLKSLASLLQTEEKKDLATEELADLSKQLESISSKDNQHSEFNISEEKEITEKPTNRSRRDARNVNNLLNQEMFLQGEKNQQYRTIRKVFEKKVPEIDAESAIIIGPDDENIAKDEVSIEDGSGTEVIDTTFPEISQFGKFKREYKKIENIFPGHSKATERIPLVAVGAKPEVIKSSTEKMPSNRDTRESERKKPPKKLTPNFANTKKPDYSNLQNYSENSQNPSRKRVRNIFGVVGKALEENKLSRNQNSAPVLQLPKVNIPAPINIPVYPSADEIKQRVAEARMKLRSIFQDMTNSMRSFRPFTAKRETAIGQIPLTRFKAFQESQETRNAEILRNLKEGIENLKLMQNSDTLKNTFSEAKLNEFIEKSEEQLNKLRSTLQAKQDEILEKYKSKSIGFFKKTDNNYDAKNLFTPDNDFKSQISNWMSSLKPREDNSLLKREIKFPKLLDLVNLARTRILGDESEDLSSEQDEFLKTLTRFFMNHLKNYPLILLGAEDPSDIYPPTQEQTFNIVEEDLNYDEEPKCDELASEEEDENWNYKDNKYRRISRSAKLDPLASYQIDPNLEKNTETENDKNEKCSRKRRDTETETDFGNTKEEKINDFQQEDEVPAENLNSDSQQPPSAKKRKSKKRKNKVIEPDYMDSPDYPTFPENPMPFGNPNYYSPSRFYDYPTYQNYHPSYYQTPSADQFPINYNYHYDQNSAHYYPPLYRRRRQVDDNVKTIDKSTTDASIDQQQITKNTLTNDKKENADLDCMENAENCLESLENCSDDFSTENTVKNVTNNFDGENSGMENQDSEEMKNSSMDEEKMATDGAQNNLEALMSIEKIYDKFVPSTEHRVHSRKMMPENEKNDSTFFQDVTKTIKNVFNYFSNMTNNYCDCNN